MYQCMYVCMNVYMFVCMHVYMGMQCWAARIVLRVRFGGRRSVTATLQQLHWLLVKYRIDYKLFFFSRSPRPNAGVAVQDVEG